MKARNEYLVCITETRVRNVVVKANNPSEAQRIASELYNEEEIVLNSDDFDDYSVECLGEQPTTIY